MSWALKIFLVLLLYIIACSRLRFRRRDGLRAKYHYPDRASLSKMTNVEAQAILESLSELEFPRIFLTSLQFALFKTYGIPTISKLLAETRQFSSAANASKRYTDTSVLITEFSSHHPKAERVIKAIARMNYIHSAYQQSGKISNDDLLYTLSVFITEPTSWVERFEFRAFEDFEKCAISTFWKSIGDAMGIQYSGVLAHDTWVDGLEFFDDIRAWAENYEIKYMKPCESNKKTADELVPLLLFYVPGFLQQGAANIVGVLMGPRLRAAMMYPPPPQIYSSIFTVVIEARRFFLRYLSPPRPQFMRVRDVADSPDPNTGRYHKETYLVHPYYVKPGFINRYGLESWFVRTFGGDVPGSKGGQYIPEGYVFEEVGPIGMKNKGLKKTEAFEAQLRVERPLGCPFISRG